MIVLDSFFQLLLDLVGDHLPPDKISLTGNKRKGGKTQMALSSQYGPMLLCWGDPFDIADRRMVGDGEPLRSLWFVVDAIHAVDGLKINFPMLHREQVRIAKGFKAKSAINIDSCVGAIDGILIGIHKPSEAFWVQSGPCNVFQWEER